MRSPCWHPLLTLILLKILPLTTVTAWKPALSFNPNKIIIHCLKFSSKLTSRKKEDCSCSKVSDFGDLLTDIDKI